MTSTYIRFSVACRALLEQAPEVRRAWCGIYCVENYAGLQRANPRLYRSSSSWRVSDASKKKYLRSRISCPNENTSMFANPRLCISRTNKLRNVFPNEINDVSILDRFTWSLHFARLDIAMLEIFLSVVSMYVHLFFFSLSHFGLFSSWPKRSLLSFIAEISFSD